MSLLTDMTETGGPESDTAQRMQTLRFLQEGGDLGAQVRFAVWLGITPKRWNNVERGFPVSRGLADKLIKKFPGLTLDWIYHGSESGLTGAILKRLAEASRKRGAS